MLEQIQELHNKIRRINQKQQIYLTQYQLAVEEKDGKKADEIRSQVHDLLDELLDFYAEVEVLKKENEANILKRFRDMGQ